MRADASAFSIRALNTLTRATSFSADGPRSAWCRYGTRTTRLSLRPPSSRSLCSRCAGEGWVPRAVPPSAACTRVRRRRRVSCLFVRLCLFVLCRLSVCLSVCVCARLRPLVRPSVSVCLSSVRLRVCLRFRAYPSVVRLRPFACGRGGVLLAPSPFSSCISFTCLVPNLRLKSYPSARAQYILKFPTA